MAKVGGETAALSSVAVNAGLAVAKVWGGLLTGSAALMADGAHSTLDVASSAVAYVGTRVGRQPPDADHRYGHHKFEYFAGAIITALLFVTGGVIVWQSADRLLNPVPLRATTIGLIIAGVSVVANELLAVAKTRAAEDESLFSLRVDALHDHTDAASSLLVFVGLAAVQAGLPASADAVAAIGVAVIVLWLGGSMGRDAFDVLVDKAPPGELLQRMDRAARNVDGVRDAHALRARVVGDGVFVDLHVLVDPEITVRAGHDIAHDVEEALLDVLPGPGNVVVHVEPEGDEARADAGDAPPPP